ncbi:hypothetical protein QTO34_001733 [Cnephaeus nilssonii]|uniref:Murine leukemia virus integrase C-terminal domain-containing protein n=1 Tax=Cnephaeus nilssonii TaxID=3371016 RepID=A0AA40LKQ7_CNENI|nr:hypothetical protein QTO34_001733 [Eptesicus nilssonii]
MLDCCFRPDPCRPGRGTPPYQLPSGTQDPGFPCSPGFVQKVIQKDVQKDVWLRGLLAQTLPLKFTVHHVQPGDLVLIKTWKEDKLQPSWEAPTKCSCYRDCRTDSRERTIKLDTGQVLSCGNLENQRRLSGEDNAFVQNQK